MRISIGALLCLPMLAAGAQKPLNPHIDSLFPAAPTAFLTDLSGQVKNSAEVNLVLHTAQQKDSLNLVAVVMPTIGRFVPSDVALEIGRRWKVATRNDTIGNVIRNTGGVILLVLDSHQCRVEVATGSEGYVTDNTAADMCRAARFYFRAGYYGQGIISIANTFVSKHRQELQAIRSPSKPHAPTHFPWLPLLLSCIALSFAGVLGHVLHSRKQRRKAIELEEFRKKEALEAAKQEVFERQRKARWERDRQKRMAEAAAMEQRFKEERDAAEETERRRRAAMTPEERLAEDKQREQRRVEAQQKEDQRKRLAAIAAEETAELVRRRRQQEDEDNRRREDDERRRRDDSSYGGGYSSSSDSGSSGGSIGGGSDSFNGGGGGSSW